MGSQDGKFLILGKTVLSGAARKGKFHQSAIRALAFKRIRIIYRCWKTRTRYDEAKYLSTQRATFALTEAIQSLSNVSGREAEVHVRRIRNVTF